MGAPVPADDRSVIRALVQAAIPTEERLSEYRIGIRNMEGRIYRLVRLYSLAERTRFTSAITALGFVEESGLWGARTDGYDVTFRRR